MGVMKRLYTARMLGVPLQEFREPLFPLPSPPGPRRTLREGRQPVATYLGQAGKKRPWPGSVSGTGCPFEPGHIREGGDLDQPRDPDPERPPATHQGRLFD